MGVRVRGMGRAGIVGNIKVRYLHPELFPAAFYVIDPELDRGEGGLGLGGVVRFFERKGEATDEAAIRRGG